MAVWISRGRLSRYSWRYVMDTESKKSPSRSASRLSSPLHTPSMLPLRKPSRRTYSSLCRYSVHLRTTSGSYLKSTWTSRGPKGEFPKLRIVKESKFLNNRGYVGWIINQTAGILWLTMGLSPRNRVCWVLASWSQSLEVNVAYLMPHLWTVFQGSHSFAVLA